MPNYRWYLTLQDPQQIFFRFQSENLHEKETVEMYFWITYLDSVHFFLIYMEFFLKMQFRQNYFFIFNFVCH